jgi:hypothetical protein
MSNVGAPNQGDQPGFSVDTSLGTEIERYQLVQVSENTTTANVMMVGLCNTDSTGRLLACGVAFRAWPYVPQIYQTSARASSDRSAYDTDRKQRIAIRQEGYTWFKVALPSGGSNDASISPGDWLYPSEEVAGGVNTRPASTLTGTYNSATIEAELAEDQNVVGRAYSNIVIPASGASYPEYGVGLGVGTPVATLTALTNAVTYGYVFGKLGKG